MDVFESSYAYSAAERGCVLVFPLTSPSGGVEGEKLQYEESIPFEIDLKSSE